MRTQCNSKPLELEGHCSRRRHLVAKKLIIEISGVNVFVLKRRQALDRLAGFSSRQGATHRAFAD